MRPLTILLAVAMLAAGCAQQTAAPAGVEPLRSDTEFSPAQAPASDLAAMAAGDLAFTVDLLRAVAEGDNVFISPMSIATALGMLEVGARSETLAEIQAVLHEAAPVHGARGALVARLAEGEELPPEVEADPFVLRSVNSLWLQRDYPVLSDFLDTLAEDYDAGLFLVDYAGDAESARVAINDWVADQTEDRIKDLIPPGLLSSLTRLVLTNAVYFKASWEEPFDPSLTEDGTFTLTDGTRVTVPMMTTAGSFSYVDGDGFQAVWLPYWGGTSMMVVLPDGSPQEFLDGLDADALIDAIGTDRRFAELAMPRFEFEAEFSLGEVLRSLGMVTSFAPPPGPGTADFSGITEQPELFVSEVLHKAYVAVDEEGTEAAAATAIVMEATSAPIDEPLTLRLDRPFVFLIQDDLTGDPIFAGVVENPTG